jgi:hypothetical protein
MSIRAHGKQGAPSWRAADDEAPLLCRVVRETLGRPSAVSSLPRHMVEELCRRYHCRVLFAVCLHTAEGLPWPKAALPCE